jgi:Uma2 family endonuclease
MAETDLHRDLMVDCIKTLDAFYADDPRVYVSGNILLYYIQGNPRKHVSPDVLVSKDRPKGQREYYLVWVEGKAPDLVIELTSRTTRREDLKDKFILYRDVLRVREYFLFDPRAEYLTSPLQGYRLEKGEYVAIEPVDGRLPSEVLGLHLERHGSELRFYNLRTGEWLPTPQEMLSRAETALRETKAEQKQEKAARKKAEAARKKAEAARKKAEAEREQVKAENERLRRELEVLRHRLS